MKNQNYKLKDLIRIWMKACFKQAMAEPEHASESAESNHKKESAKSEP
jgi:hypothetical protein